MASRAASTVLRTSHRLGAAHRAALAISVNMSTYPIRAAAVTASIGKTKGVSGPDVSSYPPPKHLEVPSGLTPEQVCSQKADSTDSEQDQSRFRMSQ